MQRPRMPWSNAEVFGDLEFILGWRLVQVVELLDWLLNLPPSWIDEK